MRVSFLTFHKCGSQWVRAVLSDPEMLRRAGLRAAIPGMNLLEAPWPAQPEATFAGPLYNASAAGWDGHRRDGDKAVIVLRDPRDVIVSHGYSVGYSHGPSATVDLLRPIMQSLDVRGRLCVSMSIFRFSALAFRSWVRRAERQEFECRTRYEDLLADSLAAFTRLIRFLGWPVEDEVIARCVERHSFQNYTGRQPGEADPLSHQRRGVAGDWKNHFDRELAEAFEHLFPGLLMEAGYENSVDWPQSLPERASGLDDVRAEINRLREESLHARRISEERRLLIKRLDAEISELKARSAAHPA